MPATTQAAASLLAFATFGDLLKYLRRRARLTQLELSIAVGYTEAHISRLERNERLPDLAALAALFIPALHLDDEPEAAARLMELAALARGEHTSPTGSLTLTRSVAQTITESVETVQDFPPHNLPLQLTSFIGRDEVMAEVRRLLAESRLVTLTGEGGSGKTRLALQVAAGLTPAYRHGVWLVELARLSDPALVPQAVAAVLGAPEQLDRSLTQALAHYLFSRHALLILDNCEHVVTSAAQLADSLLRACPQLKILATSREALAISGEVAFRVPALTLPERSEPASVESLARTEAVQLFVERARNVLPAFALTNDNAAAVAQICHQLDGMPLAIELAAARVTVLAVQQIAAHLAERDRFDLLKGGSRTALPRHQTLRAVIDWSYDLLAGQEKTLFRRLSIFAGGWTLEAAEAVAGDERLERPEQPAAVRQPLASTVLDVLARLVNKSLVAVEGQHAGAARYRMLETVRHYSHERLLESGEWDVIARRHFDYCQRLVEEAEPGLLGAERRARFNRLELEHDNIRAALARGPSSGGAEGMQRLAGALFWFWQSRGYVGEGRVHLEKALGLASNVESARHPGQAAAHAKALWAAGSLAWIQGEYATARSQLDESVRLWRQLGAPGGRGLAIALRELGIVATCQGELDHARAALEESVRLTRAAGSQWDLALALYNEGLVYEALVDGDTTRSRFEDSLALFRALSETWGMSVALNGLGRIAGRRGDYAAARAHLEESLALSRSFKDPWSVAQTLYLLGEVAQRQDDAARATSLYAECLALNQDVGDSVMIGFALHHFGQMAQLHGQLRQAATVFGAAALLRERANNAMSWSLTSHADCDRDIDALRALLGEAEFATAWARGQAMTPAQAIAKAGISIRID